MAHLVSHTSYLTPLASEKKEKDLTPLVAGLPLASGHYPIEVIRALPDSSPHAAKRWRQSMWSLWCCKYCPPWSSEAVDGEGSGIGNLTEHELMAFAPDCGRHSVSMIRSLQIADGGAHQGW